MILYGPQWQWECEVCGEMSECSDSPAERDEELKEHTCSLPWKFRNLLSLELLTLVEKELNQIKNEDRIEE